MEFTIEVKSRAGYSANIPTERFGLRIIDFMYNRFSIKQPIDELLQYIPAVNMDVIIKLDLELARLSGLFLEHNVATVYVDSGFLNPFFELDVHYLTGSQDVYRHEFTFVRKFNEALFLAKWTELQFPTEILNLI